MPSVEPHRDPEEVARLAAQIFEGQIRPSLRPEDDGKFIAIDVANGEYELDEDDYTAVMRLRGRRPTAEIWLGCVGQPAAYHMRRVL